MQLTTTGPNPYLIKKYISIIQASQQTIFSYITSKLLSIQMRISDQINGIYAGLWCRIMSAKIKSRSACIPWFQDFKLSTKFEWLPIRARHILPSEFSLLFRPHPELYSCSLMKLCPFSPRGVISRDCLCVPNMRARQRKLLPIT